MTEFTYTEKIEKLKNIFGQWPPAGTPWCLQVGGGRCGTNSLFDMVKSLLGDNRVTNATFSQIFKVDNEEKTFDALYRSGRTPDTYQNQYLYYNVHEFYYTNIIESLHFPIFLHWLEHSPKVILLKREDYFLRGLSIHFADILANLSTSEFRVYNEEVYDTPIDVKDFKNRLFPYIVESEALTKIVRKMVDPLHLYEVCFSDLYEYRTFRTLKEITNFLEIDITYQNKLEVSIYKETHYDKIKNLNEVMEAFGREDMKEKERFIPAIYDSQEISEEADRLADFTIENNMPEVEKKRGVSKKITLMCPNPPPFSAKIQEAGVFYLDEIPNSARYLKTEEFSVLPNMYENVHMLDPRWNSLDTEIPAHINEFFEVTDIASNAEGSHKWICGFSVFFLKYVMDSQTEHLERKTTEKYENLIRGVRELIEFPDRCPETLLRFYVSPDAWERLAQEGLLKTKDVEFYKMAYPSEDSQFGALWRMMALFDKRFQWAIQTDVPTKPAPEDEWVYARIADWDRQTFKDWLEKNTGRNWAWAGEYLFFNRNFSNVQHLFHEKHRAWNVSQFDYLSGGGIVTRPERMPPVEAVLHRHLAERPLHLTFYHADKDVWCQFPGYEYQVPLGWEGWGIDQTIWAFLKKVLPVRHIVHEQSLQHIEETAPKLSKDHLMFRIINQLQQEGSEFVHWETLKPIFTPVD